MDLDINCFKYAGGNNDADTQAHGNHLRYPSTFQKTEHHTIDHAQRQAVEKDRDDLARGAPHFGLGIS